MPLNSLCLIIDELTFKPEVKKWLQKYTFLCKLGFSLQLHISVYCRCG